MLKDSLVQIPSYSNVEGSGKTSHNVDTIAPTLSKPAHSGDRDPSTRFFFASEEEQSLRKTVCWNRIEVSDRRHTQVIVMLSEIELPLAEAQRVEASLSSSLPVVHGSIQLAIDRQVSPLVWI